LNSNFFVFLKKKKKNYFGSDQIEKK